MKKKWKSDDSFLNRQPPSSCHSSFIHPQPCLSVKGTVSEIWSSRAQILELQVSSAHPPSPKLARELRWSSHLKDDLLTPSHPSTRQPVLRSLFLNWPAAASCPYERFIHLSCPSSTFRTAFLAHSPWHFRTSATSEIVNDYLLEYLSPKWLMWMKWQWKCARHSNGNHGGQDLAKGELLIKVA